MTHKVAVFSDQNAKIGDDKYRSALVEYANRIQVDLSIFQRYSYLMTSRAKFVVRRTSAVEGCGCCVREH